MNPYEVSLGEREIWISKSVLHFQKSAIGSVICEKKCVLALVIPLMRCRGFENLMQLRQLTT